MLKNAIAAVVAFCTHFAYAVIAVAVVGGAAAGHYAVEHFAINTNVDNLISPLLPWRQREINYNRSFPDPDEKILAVVEAPTPEFTSLARSELVKALTADSQLFPQVTEPGGGAFFARNALLFPSIEEVQGTLYQLTKAAPLIRIPVTDPSLRGFAQMISLVLAGVREDAITAEQAARPFNAAAVALDNVLAGRAASFSWREIVSEGPPNPGDLRGLIDIVPKLDFGALEPGEAATNAIRAAAAKLDLAAKYQARVRLTGPVAIENEEFATLKEGALANGIITMTVVLIILWLALRSGRIILATAVSLFVGLSITAALGLLMVGALNPISIAFAVLFVGLGVDFGIQFSVRYRQERFKEADLPAALRETGARVGIPLTLAAAAVAAGFLSFLPTAYRGLSELGQIAGVGMIVAYLTSITVLPALLRVLRPPGEKEPLGFQALAPVDNFLETHRVAIVVLTLGVAIAGLPLLYYLKFDFNPMNLRSAKVESMATYLDLRRDPSTGVNAVNVLVPSVAEADAVSRKLKALPEVAGVTTITTFVPDDQEAKLAAIAQAAMLLDPVLQAERRPAPTDEENVAAIKHVVDELNEAAGKMNGTGADAVPRLAAALSKLAQAEPAVRARAEAVFMVPAVADIDDIRSLLQAQPVTLDNLPPDATRDWRTADGKIRVSAVPTGDPTDNENLRTFARAVLAAEPAAIGGPISILESGDTVVRAFLEAGGWALGAIAILLWLTLRRLGDVLLTLVPLLVAGAVTLEVCVLIGMPLNYANIIALPLLLGVGVAFKIYYMMAWRAGRTKLLQSSLTRAVIFSAATTATAFGSLWFSSHPGTSSMGKLMALALACTLAAAVLFQPALMGRPRTTRET
jgi:hopanoid biosynthesis associated RND transporter like protein HpnN